MRIQSRNNNNHYANAQIHHRPLLLGMRRGRLSFTSPDTTFEQLTGNSVSEDLLIVIS